METGKVDRKFVDLADDAFETFLHQKYGKYPQIPDCTNLQEFLEESSAFDMPPAERLRRWAIYLDERGHGMDVHQKWNLLRNTYAYAAELDRADVLVLKSWGVSSRRCAQREQAPILKREMFADAERAYASAIELAPNDADIAYHLGYTIYTNPDSNVQDALSWFRKAVSLDSSHAMAWLYVGHCLQDMRDWRGALEAYLKVDQEALARAWPIWRTNNVRMMIGYCNLKMGQHADALKIFSQLLDELERISVAGEDPWDHFASFQELIEAASGDLRGQLYDKAQKYIPDFDSDNTRAHVT
jgi:tetratricopeptide (TPR) repeat protein